MLLKTVMMMLMMILMMLSLCRSIPITETTFDDSSEAEHYLSQYGYYGHQEPRAHSLVMADSGSDSKQIDTGYHMDTDKREAILKLQQFFGLPQTGQLDKATVELMRSPRCGVVDIQDDQTPEDTKGSSGGRRHKRYAFPRREDGSPIKWDLSELTWALKYPSRQLSEYDQKQIIKEALQIWAKVVPITFREDRRPDVVPDIVIKFASGRHGPESDPVFDGAPKDRPNVLAHAWGPHSNPKGTAGDVHFDAQDSWPKDTLLAVAVHELGHSMGLYHSKDQTAIMYPLYQTMVELAEDDIRGIEAIYGSGRRPLTARPPATRSPEVRRTEPATRRPQVTRLPVYRTLQPTWKPTQPPIDNKCSQVDVEAIFVDPAENSRRYIAISGDQVHQLSTNGQLLKSEEISTVFPGAPQKADVAFSFDGKVYFIKDFKLWAYNKHQLQDGYPRTLNSGTLPETPKFAVLYKDARGNHRPLLFGRSKWWTFSENGSPRSMEINEFAGPIPNNVVFGAHWSDNLVYIVTRNSYIKIDQANRKILDEEPIPGMPDWLSELCSTGSRTPAVSFISTLVISACVYLTTRVL